MDQQRFRFPLLVDALRLLPVHPFKERDAFGEARHLAMRTGAGELRGVPVKVDDLEHLFVQDGSGAPRISPAGAALLLSLYRQGAMEASGRKIVPGGVELLEAYSEGNASILGGGFWGRPRRSAKRPRRPVERPQPISTPQAPSNTQQTTVLVSAYDRPYRITTHRLT